MECRFSAEDLSAFADGELDAIRSRSIEAHLRVCAKCREQFEAARDLSALLGGACSMSMAPRVQAKLARRLAMSEDSPAFTCARAQHWISASLDGELGADQARLLHAHVAQCPACASESMALQAVSQVMRAVPEVAPPIGLERCIRAAVAHEHRGWLPRWLTEGVWAPRLGPGLATAMAAATLFGGIWIGRNLPGTTVATRPPIRVFQGAPVTASADKSATHAAPEREGASTPLRQRHQQERELLVTIAKTLKPFDPGPVAPFIPLPRPASRAHHPALPTAGFAPAPSAPIAVATGPRTVAPPSEAPTSPVPAAVAESPLPPQEMVAAAPSPGRHAPQPALAIPPIQVAQATPPTAQDARHEAWKAKWQDDLQHEAAVLQSSQPQDKALRVPLLTGRW